MTTATQHDGTPTAGPAGTPGTDEDDAVLGDDQAGGIGGRFQAILGRIDAFQRGHRVVAFPYAVVKKFGDDQAGNLAALVAYYSFFSIFPVLLVFVTIVGFVLQDNEEAQQKLLDSALSQFPVVGDELKSNIGSISGSGVALLVGTLFALWAGLGALEAMQNAMNSVWNVPKHARPSFLVAKLRSLLMLVLLGSVIVGSTVLSSASAYADSLPVGGRYLALALTTLINVGMFVGGFKLLTEKDIDWKAMVPGAVVAGIGFTIIQVLGGWYVTRVISNASRTYGTFAVVLGLLTLLYLMAQVVVYAAEINVVRHEHLWPRGLVTDDLTAADRRALERYAHVEERLPDQEIEVELPDPAPSAPTSTTTSPTTS